MVNDCPAMTLDEATVLAGAHEAVLSMAHIVDHPTEPGRYYVMRHINCEFCVYCEDGHSGFAGPGRWYTANHRHRDDPYPDRDDA